MNRSRFRSHRIWLFALFLAALLPARAASAQSRLVFTQGPEPKSLDLALHPNGSIDA